MSRETPKPPPSTPSWVAALCLPLPGMEVEPTGAGTRAAPLPRRDKQSSGLQVLLWLSLGVAVTLGKSLPLYGPQFPHLGNRRNDPCPSSSLWQLN